MKKCLVVVFSVISAYGGVMQAQEAVSIESLLAEMVDRNAVARFPSPEFRLKQDSSYNRASVEPQSPQPKPTGWFANRDYNTKASDGNFIRVETLNGREEFVLMESKAPGVIVRSWMPWHNPDNAASDLIIRFYLDGSDEPVLEGNMLGLLNGQGLISRPFAHASLRSAVSFFPIPYAQGCKVTVSDCPFFFQFTYREYEAGTPVTSFTREDFEAASDQIEAVGQSLLNPRDDTDGDAVKIETTLAPGEEQSVDLAAGVAAVRALSVKLGSYDDPEVTRKVILKMSFDGKDTVWCPIGDFFGGGIGLNPVRGWFRTVAEDGTMTSRWVMPYQTSGTVSVVNLSDDPVEVTLNATTGAWAWDDASMLFHAEWRGQYPVPTRPFSDWNYITTQGRGVYVGDTLTVMNPVEKWWGEGDEKIFVDGEDFPSIFGTGTEDYYAYSWGGRSTDFYEHPFHNQPFCHIYNKHNRKAAAKERNTMGYSTEGRDRDLDTMPFGTSLQLDMEVWSGTDCDMGYGVGVFWYGDAATTSNRRPDPEQARNVPPLPPEMGPDFEAGAFKNAAEFEAVEVVAQSADLAAVAQDLTRFNGAWSGNAHLLIKNTDDQGFIELRVPAISPVPERLVLHATKSRDFGIVRFHVNGQPAGEPIDLYAGKPRPTGPITLGDFEPVDNAYLIRVEVVGKHAQSSGVRFGLDCVSLLTAD